KNRFSKFIVENNELKREKAEFSAKEEGFRARIEIKQKQITPIENHLDKRNAQITESIPKESDITDDTTNSDEHQEETKSRVFNSSSTALSICVKSKSEGKEMDL
ncbi:11331_t:CDS:2, partial [Acaulospora morrowiae]